MSSNTSHSGSSSGLEVCFGALGVGVGFGEASTSSQIFGGNRTASHELVNDLAATNAPLLAEGIQELNGLGLKPDFDPPCFGSGRAAEATIGTTFGIGVLHRDFRGKGWSDDFFAAPITVGRWT